MSTTNKGASARRSVTPAASRAAPRPASGTRQAIPDRERQAREQAEQAQLRTLVLQALDDLKARDTHEVDVRDKSSVTDLLVVTSGTSSRHVRSIADEVVKLTKQAGMPPLGVEGAAEGEWVLVDLGDIVVHVMQPRIREFYGLERLWTVGDDPVETAAEAG